ncbi:glucosamine-6-phosphate deaminase [Streptomyces millisiae]|uniref:Glucosamine-6-phosphate deaminase n=1 Tax=Streptomyces millisiae TaxID=3075542 RepID=A0ABU2LJC9_9ACTN|nr:glucosamine-6-phosphate deaminase [Streptomyces sp. DSM 44918]MDT0317691.1 glucosamine-6-phosphate deaminase [Streptomyces sp. DSM 44918]
MTEVVIVSDAAAGGELAARAVLAALDTRPDAVLGLATGSTPLPVYRALAELIGRERRDVSRVGAFALDEYVGLPADHPQSYRSYVAREVTGPLGLDPRLVHVPDGDPERARTAGEEYERAIEAAGGVDVQLLGIGTDGHLGFNEPGSSFASRTRVKTLTERTRRDNARFFTTPDEVPLHCVTQGLGTILRARHLLLLAFGASKAPAIAAAVEGPLTASHPASAVQLHPHATVIVDEPAASRLANLDYYRHAWANKPAWQGI